VAHPEVAHPEAELEVELEAEHPEVAHLAEEVVLLVLAVVVVQQSQD
jgi:hypothetical protein